MTARKVISIVTPCLNAERYIRETLDSVLQQTALSTGNLSLDYIVCDGGSSDGTLSILETYRSPHVRVVHGPDAGLYDALATGLEMAKGDYVGYINAGDFFNKGAFDVVTDCFELDGVDWLTGYAAIYNDRSQITSVSLPFRFRQRLFECGAYGTILPFVQQESTLWKRKLHADLDFAKLRTLRYAGDFYLWRTFSRRAALYVVRSNLGGFRKHRGQISEAKAAYVAELRGLCRDLTLVDRLVAALDGAIWLAPDFVKALFNRELIMFDHNAGAWRKAKYSRI
jgi:glycosyltransferase involved in cell wall biosynthesis